jgi:HNH endonuclease/NUMOD4 motif
MEENWRPIPGHAGYEVSDLGRVRSIDRVVTKTQGGRAVQVRRKGRVLRPYVSGSGYLILRLGSDSGLAYVHQLVLLAFVGPRPAGCQAAHDDGNRLNNVVANLRWATASENNIDKRRHGTSSLGARKSRCKYGHAFDEANTVLVQGRRRCKTCERDRRRKYRGIPPSRFREPIEPRLSEGLRLMAEGMSTTRAAQLAKIDRGTLGRAWRSGRRAA